MQKLYCYVDERGQDARSTFFMVAAVITEEDEQLKEKLSRIEKSIQTKATQIYRAIVVVDGIDNKKAAELTGALRLKDIILDFVRSGRDESEALLRLADRWVGCARKAREEKNSEESLIMQNALTQGYLQSLSK